MDQYEVKIMVGPREMFWGTAIFPGHSSAVNWANKAGRDLCALNGIPGGFVVQATLIPPTKPQTTLTELTDATFDGYSPATITPPVIGPSSGPSPATGGPLGGVE